jgi:hypothetical protein
MPLMGLVISAVWGRFCVLAGLILLRRLIAESKAKSGFKIQSTFYLAASPPKIAIKPSGVTCGVNPERSGISDVATKRVHNS